MPLFRLLCQWKFWRDNRGQDLIEYALMCAGFSMAIVAVIPNLQPLFSTAFSNIESVLVAASAS
ncbi:MAG: Flp family type IVb pilin [Acidobacteria bacterium]|nr:Flp family type IVb pilin [Acidobacteriota bacterium]